MICLDRKITTYLRAISICAVIFGHVFGGAFGVISIQTQSLLGNSGVTIFLLLSGYGLYASYRKKGLKLKEFWSSKINQLFLPYALITILYYFFLLATKNAPGIPILLENILFIDYARNMDASMWYMSFLVIWYIVFFIVFYFDYPDVAKIMFLFLLAAAIKRGWQADCFTNCSWQFRNNAYVFPFGVAMGFLMDKLCSFSTELSEVVNKYHAKLVLFLLCFIVFLMGLLNVFSLSTPQNGFLLFVMLYLILSKYRGEIKVLHFLGQISFFMYLIEMKWIQILFSIPLMRNNIVLFCFTYTVAMALSVVIYKISQKFASSVTNKPVQRRE